MSLFDRFDFAHGELPGWLNNAVALTRPLATTMTVAIPSAGACTVGSVAAFDPPRAFAMAEASTKFLQGIPDAGWGAIVAIALGYTASKTAEAIKAGKNPAAVAPAAPPPPDPRVFDTSRLEIPHPSFGKAPETEIIE